MDSHCRSNDSDSSDNEDNVEFRSNYAKALAQALRQAQEETDKAPPAAVLRHETYRQFCFDDPVVGAAGCRSLAKALLEKEKKDTTVTMTTMTQYALSERFVNGLQQLLVASTTTASASAEQAPAPPAENDASTTTTAENDNADTLNLDEPLFVSTVQQLEGGGTTSSAGAAHATLAWTVYGRIPLAVCTADTLQAAAIFLGSYRGADIVDNSNDHDDVEAVVDQLLDATIVSTQTNTTDNVNASDNDSGDSASSVAQSQSNDNGLTTTPRPMPPVDETEVWAAESDASDFDFGDEMQLQQQQQLDLTHWNWTELDTDPYHLSTVPADTTWKNVAQAVTNLVSSLQFSTTLGNLAAADWKALRISESLTQLTLLLFVVPNDSVGGVWREWPATHWQQLGLQPLTCFRDAALHYTRHHGETALSASAVTVWQDYLHLLLTMVQVHHAAQASTGVYTPCTSNMASPPVADDSIVAPATWVGCSSLSALCNHCIDNNKTSSNSGSNLSVGNRRKNANRQLVTSVQECVLQCCDDLTFLLETTANSEVGVSLAIQWTFLAFFQVLSISTASAASVTGKPPLSNAQAQILLNSGLFRQWLVWWEKMDPASAVCGPVQQSIFSLCAASPTLLGKYAWRLPGLAARVTTTVKAATKDEGDQEETLDVFLWNLLGIELAQSTTTGSVVQWKNTAKNTVASTPMKPACQEAAGLGFQILCQRLVEILSGWKKQRQDELPMPDNFVEQQRMAASFVRLVDTLLSTPLLTTLFCKSMAPDKDKPAQLAGIRTELKPIQQVLANWPQTAMSHEAKVKAEEEGEEPAKVADADYVPRTRKPGAEDESVNALRRSVKIMQSLLDASANSDGPKSPCFSSKAD